MTALSPAAQAMLNEFSACKGWEQRARLLLKHGQQLPALPPELRTDKQLVRGCESPVWCQPDWPDGRLQLQLDTDARLLKGLLQVLRVRLEGLTAQQLAEVDLADWYSRLGLGRQLSSSRSNGLNAVYQYVLYCGGRAGVDTSPGCAGSCQQAATNR